LLCSPSEAGGRGVRSVPVVRRCTAILLHRSLDAFVYVGGLGPQFPAAAHTHDPQHPHTNHQQSLEVTWHHRHASSPHDRDEPSQSQSHINIRHILSRVHQTDTDNKQCPFFALLPGHHHSDMVR